MNLRVTLFVPGNPAPKGSRVTGTTKTGHTYNRESSKRAGPWVKKVAQMASYSRPSGKPLAPPYRVNRVYVMPRPKRSTHEWPSIGDIDKLDRAVFDGLTQGGLIVDDRHIVGGAHEKRYALPGEQAGVRVDIA